MADFGENFWINKAQTAEAKLGTLQANMEATLNRVKQFKANFGVRERSDGSLVIDYDKFVENLGTEGCLELRRIIDERYSISGEPGKKPRIKVRVPASAA